MITTIKKEILEKTFPTFDDARCRLQEWAGGCGFSVKVTHTIHSHSILLKPLPNYALSLIVVVGDESGDESGDDSGDER